MGIVFNIVLAIIIPVWIYTFMCDLKRIDRIIHYSHFYRTLYWSNIAGMPIKDFIAWWIKQEPEYTYKYLKHKFFFAHKFPDWYSLYEQIHNDAALAEMAKMEAQATGTPVLKGTACDLCGDCHCKQEPSV
jgi:hypothetical protein